MVQYDIILENMKSIKSFYHCYAKLFMTSIVNGTLFNSCVVYHKFVDHDDLTIQFIDTLWL